ncbi:MAG: hypothetical protein [Caudoviricetes sp.]|nr:MAG: hypothetical protein [Caudoviricetes sp.]
MLDKLNQPKGSTIGVLKDGRTIQEAIDKLDQGYIRVSSREELIDAVNFVNTMVKKTTQIRLSADFAPWSAPQTDIDVSWVSIVGDGQAVRIDCSGIPNVAGNYALKLYSTQASAIGNIPFLGGDKLVNVMFIGPSGIAYPDRKVDGLIFDAGGQGRSGLGNFATRGVTVTTFNSGVTIGQNAYIVHMFEPRIDRCTTHLHMKAASNSGEGVITYGGTLGTSAGILLKNENGNGALRCFGTSLDYAGAVAIAERGSIELYGCHIEFENGTNDLKRVPFYTGSAQDARILIHGGEMLSFKGLNPITQPAVFESTKGSMGITVRDMKMAFLVTSTGKLQQGDGTFVITGTGLLDGSGNASISRGVSANNSIAMDTMITGTTPVDWSISQVATGGQEPTDRWTSQTGTIKRVDTPKVSDQHGGSLAVTKLFGGGAVFSIDTHVATSNNAHMGATIKLLAGAGTTGSIGVNFSFARVAGYDSLGRPMYYRRDVGQNRTLDLSTAQADWVNVNSFAAKNPAPAWATHYSVRFNLINMSKDGVIYIGETNLSLM